MAKGDRVQVGIVLKDERGNVVSEQSFQLGAAVYGKGDVSFVVPSGYSSAEVYAKREEGNDYFFIDDIILREWISNDPDSGQAVVGEGEKEADLLFSDVPDDFWAAEAIRELTARKVLEGIGGGDNRFAPQRQATRAEFVAMAMRALNVPESGGTPFDDVEAGDWYAGIAAGAVQAALFDGTAPGRFGPNEAISREQLAVLLVRAYEWTAKSSVPPAAKATYDDYEQAGEWAKAAIDAAVQAGWMNGREASMFFPKAAATRAECAQAVYNLISSALLP
jgi:hypothetical protein